MKAVLIIGHGSRNPNGNDEFMEIVEIIKNKKNMPVYGAHMSLAKPSIEETVGKMYEDGMRDVTVLPYFLYGGIHITKNIPEILAALKEKYKNINFTMKKQLGKDPLIIEALMQRI